MMTAVPIASPCVGFLERPGVVDLSLFEQCIHGIYRGVRRDIQGIEAPAVAATFFVGASEGLEAGPSLNKSRSLVIASHK